MPSPNFGGGITVPNAFNETFVRTPALPPNAQLILADRVENPDGTITLYIPQGYVPVLAQNQNGIVFLPPGQTLGNNANIIRIGDPTSQQPFGYFRVYNACHIHQ